jgi:hypothetical protein
MFIDEKDDKPLVEFCQQLIHSQLSSASRAETTAS